MVKYWLERLDYDTKGRRRTVGSNPELGYAATGKHYQQYMGTYFEPGKDKAVKGECSAQYTAVSSPNYPLRSLGFLKPLPLLVR